MVILIIVFVFFIWRFEVDLLDKSDLYGLVPASFLTIIIVLISSLFFSLIHREQRDFEYKDHETNIASLDDASSLGGRFILGSGTLRNSNVYNAYQILDDGAYKRITIPSHITYIYEDVNSQPYLKVIERKRVNPNPNIQWIIFTFYSSNKWYEHKYELHVPENTVIKELNLDNR
jgi:hypothetical protein